MDPIDEAISAIESHEDGASFSYREAAKRFGVDRTTLSRRHQGKTGSNEAQGKAQQLLSPQQESELIKYLDKCTRRGLPPTREMMQNLAGAVAKRPVSYSWVTRFLRRHPGQIVTKRVKGTDRERHQADSPTKYKLYFELLHSKMEKYRIEPQNTYNMDEKGFFVGCVNSSTRIFSKASLTQRERAIALQDGNREWITLLACVGASGVALPPALIYQGNAGIQSSWVDDLMAAQHQVFVGYSPTGWTNNDLGLAWLKLVFDRYTKAVAGRSWRLLIVDGHGSHVTADFIEYCISNRILLAIFPPHSTHSLQPLDVVLFSPLAQHYTSELNRRLHGSLGITRITKADFYSNFWPAWAATMKRDLILKSFQATGVWPMDGSPVLNRFMPRPQQAATNSKIGEQGDGDSWNQLRKDIANGVKMNTVAGRKVAQSLHSLQVNNDLLHHENKSLRDALNTKRKRTTKSTTLPLEPEHEYHGGACLWSPGKLREANTRQAAKEAEVEQLRLQKLHDRDVKAAATLYKKQQADAAKAARACAKEEKLQAKKQRAVELAKQRALKQLQREAATTQKSHNRGNRGKRVASHKPDQNTAKRRRAVAAISQPDAGPAVASPPPKISVRGRQIKTPARFK